MSAFGGSSTSTSIPNVHAAIDTSYLTVGRGGVARYIDELLREFRSIPWLRASEISYPIPNHGFRQPARMLKTLGREGLWQPFIAPRIVRKLQADVLHTPSSACVRAPAGIPKVATLHDLAYLVTPERFRRWTRLRIPAELRACVAADHLICPSESTANDAMRLLSIPASKITVIPHGSHFGPATAESKPSFHVPDEFFLFVSSLESGKNLQLLNTSYRQASEAGTPLPPLVIVGKRVEGVEDEGRPPESWIYAGRIPDEELIWLYRRTLALVYPSRFEGFGFPILEAMSLGTAVVCSRVSSLPEVGGDAPFYAEQSPGAYLEALRRVADHPDERESRIGLGFQQAAKFSWKRCASETADLYRTLASQRRPC